MLASPCVVHMNPVVLHLQSRNNIFVTIKKPVQPVTSEAFEKNYSILEIAEMWSLSERTIRRMFSEEDGIVNWKHPESRRKRGYQTLRIPESVMLRVYQRIRKAG
jgi:transcriptional regulator GlxA family with amidase domain